MMGLLHRRFGLPGMLSLGLHGLAVVAVGMFPWGRTIVPDSSSQIIVNLVELETPAAPPSAPVAFRETAASKSPVPRKPRKASVIVAVERVPRVSRARALRARTPVQKVKISVVPRPVAPVQAVAKVSEPVPSFVEVPRSLPHAVPSPVAVPGPSAFSVPEPPVEHSSLSAAGAVLPLIRPLPSAEAGLGRILRDTTAEAGTARTRVRLGDNPRPEYPRAAREAGWAGTVVLWVEVLANGLVGTVTLHKTSGHSILDEAALSAVQGWRFVPAMDGNFPLRSVVHLPVRFDLKAAN